MLRLLMLTLLLLSCGDDSNIPPEEVDESIYTSSNAESRRALVINSSAPLPSPRAKLYTESFYADVTPSDHLKITFLVDDSETMTTYRQKLSTSISAVLKHVINSNWSIAVTTLQATSYPKATISKYKNTFDYKKEFAQSVLTLQQTDADSREEKDGTIRAFIIVTNEDLTTEIRTNVEKMLSSEHIKRVYALLNTEGKSNSFISWSNSQGERVINRYGSLHIDNLDLPLQEISRDMAAVLRSNFLLRGYRSLEGNYVKFDGDYLNAKVAWNPSRSGQTGHVSESILNRDTDKADRRFFIDSRLPAGLCIDVQYSIDP